jgi:hypothetical protein
VAGFNATFTTTKAQDITFRLTPEGISPPINLAPSYLYGLTYGAALAQPQKYVITPPTDTKLTVNVRKVSDRAGARLVIIIDGKTAAEMALSPKSEPASLTVPISAGEHNVVLDNLGEDYLQLDSMEVAAYVSPLTHRRPG